MYLKIRYLWQSLMIFGLLLSSCGEKCGYVTYQLENKLGTTTNIQFKGNNDNIPTINVTLNSNEIKDVMNDAQAFECRSFPFQKYDSAIVTTNYAKYVHTTTMMDTVVIVNDTARTFRCINLGILDLSNYENISSSKKNGENYIILRLSITENFLQNSKRWVNR